MRTLNKLIIGTTVIASLIHPVGASALWESSDNDTQIQAQQAELEQFQTDFSQLRNDLNALDKYQINLRYINVDANQVLANGHIVMDSQTGDARIQFDVHQYPDDQPAETTHYDIIGYRNFDLVYMNTIDLLYQTDFFYQPHFNGEIRRQMREQKDNYVAVDTADVGVNLANSLASSLLYLPNLDQLKDIAPENRYHLKDVWLVDAKRLEIPTGFYQNAGNFNLDYQFNMEVNKSDSTLKAYEVGSHQSMNVASNTYGLGMKLGLSSKMTDDLLSQWDRLERPKDFFWGTDIKTNHVTDKLTGLSLYINPHNKRYAVTLTGLYEEFLLNIFSNKTADIVSFNYRLELSISPTEEVIPAMSEINSMTLDELDFQLEKLLKSNHSNNNTITQ